MPLVEVDEGELTVARSAKALLDKLGTGNTRSKLLHLVKEVNPDAPIPELDSQRPVLDEVAKLKAEMEAERKARAEEKAEAEKSAREAKVGKAIEKGRAALRAQGYTDEGIEKVEQLMADKGILDYDDALAVYERNHKTPDEPILSIDYSKSWDVAAPQDKDDSHKLLLRDPDAFARREVNEVLKELRAPNWRTR